MAVPVFTNLGTSASGTDLASYTTASIAPAANRVLFAGITNQRLTTATPATPTLSGGGVSTWTLVATGVQNTDQRVSVFRADTGSSPGSAVVTIDYGGETQTTCSWAILSTADALRTGTNAADAVAQSVSGGASSGTAFTLSLPNPLGAADNQILAFAFRGAAGATMTWATGFSGVSGAVASASGVSQVVGSGRDGSSQTVSGTWSSGGERVSVAIEVVGDTGAAPAATVTGGWFGR